MRPPTRALSLSQLLRGQEWHDGVRDAAVRIVMLAANPEFSCSMRHAPHKNKRCAWAQVLKEPAITQQHSASAAGILRGRNQTNRCKKAEHMGTVRQLKKGAFESRERAACPQETTCEAKSSSSGIHLQPRVMRGLEAKIWNKTDREGNQQGAKP